MPSLVYLYVYKRRDVCMVGGCEVCGGGGGGAQGCTIPNVQCKLKTYEELCIQSTICLCSLIVS